MKSVTTPSPKQSGVVFMLKAAFGFAVMSLLVKFASRTMPTMQIVLARGCITLVIAGLVLWRGRILPFGTKVGLMLFRGFVGSCALMCFYAAVVHLPLAEATVIHQTAPLFTALLAAWLLREPLEASVLASIALCIVGVMLIARPGLLLGSIAPADFPWQYAFVGLLGAILSAFAYVTVRRLGRSENPLVVVFYFPLVTVPMALPFALQEWVWPDFTGWLLLLGIGISTQYAQVAMTRGLAREAAGRATAVGYLQVAFASLFGAVALGEFPDGWSMLGMAAIVVALLAGLRRPCRRQD
jgi:drug/metabolite transporter (DMT)-like permease